MFDPDKIRGVPVILNSLLEKGLIDGDVITVTGNSMKRNLESGKPDIMSTKSSHNMISIKVLPLQLTHYTNLF